MNKKLSVLFACAFMYVAGGVCLKWEFSTERIISRLLIWFPWFLVRKILPAHPVGFPEQASLIIFGACEFFPQKMKDRRSSFKQSAVSVLSFVVLETSWFLSLNIFIKIIVGGTRDNHTLLCLVLKNVFFKGLSINFQHLLTSDWTFWWEDGRRRAHS